MFNVRRSSAAVTSAIGEMTSSAAAAAARSHNGDGAATDDYFFTEQVTLGVSGVEGERFVVIQYLSSADLLVPESSNAVRGRHCISDIASWHYQHTEAVASLGLVSPGAASDGCHLIPIFSKKSDDLVFSHRLLK